MKTLPLALAAALGLSSLLASPAHAAAATACTGVTRCEVVSSADVDGDGKADSVGVVFKKPTDAGPGSITVRLRTATGVQSATTGKDVYWPLKPFFGVAAVDGRPGKEIVVGDDIGAHAEQFRVVTYRKGDLVTLASPPGSGLTRPSRWGIDSSLRFHVGFKRTVSKKGVVSIIRKEAVSNNAFTRASGTKTTWVWKSGGWVKKSRVKVSYSQEAVYKIEGWHVKGLPVYAG